MRLIQQMMHRAERSELEQKKNDDQGFDPSPLMPTSTPPLCQKSCAAEPNLVRIRQRAQIAHRDVRRLPLDEIRRNLYREKDQSACVSAQEK